MADPVLRQAKDALERLSADSDARMRAEQREMALISYELDLTKSWRDGHAEGRTAGQAELLQRQLTIKFGQLPAGVAERVARASESELVRWSERLLSEDELERVFV